MVWLVTVERFQISSSPTLFVSVTHVLSTIISGTPKTPTLNKPGIIIAQTLPERRTSRIFQRVCLLRAVHVVTLQYCATDENNPLHNNDHTVRRQSPCTLHYKSLWVPTGKVLTFEPLISSTEPYCIAHYMTCFAQRFSHWTAPFQDISTVVAKVQRGKGHTYTQSWFTSAITAEANNTIKQLY